jgi:tetratricopeptide (TPR) repeat protein
VIRLALLLCASQAAELYTQANSLFQQQRFLQAQELLDRALALDPNLVPALTLQGKLGMYHNDFHTARQAFERAASLQPESPYTQFMLGFFHYVDNDFAKALPALSKTRRLAPGDPRASLYLAMTLEALGRSDEAAELFEKTIALQDSVDARIAYARLLFAAGDLEACGKQVSAASRLDPSHRDVLYESARLALERFQWNLAASYGEKALVAPGIGTTDRQIHYLLTRAYRKLGDHQKAAEHLKQFQGSGPSLRR